MADGQTVLMSSNVSRSESKAVIGLPGLSELPGFQSLTDKQSSRITGDLVLLVTPHVVHRAHAQAMGPYIPLHPRPETE